MNQTHAFFCLLLLACIVPSAGIADDGTGETIELTTIEAVTINGSTVVSIKSRSTEILARSLTIEGIGGTGGPLTITTSPQGLEMKNSSMRLTCGGKLELRTNLTNLKITRLDLISLEIGREAK